MRSRLLVVAAVAFGVAVAAAAEPTVSNVRSQQVAGTSQVEVLYGLTGAQAGGARVVVAFSTDDGATFARPPASALSGHVGAGVLGGSDRRLVWDAAATMPADFFSATMQAKVASPAFASATGFHP